MPRSTEQMIEMEFCEHAHDICLQLQAQLHRFRCLHAHNTSAASTELIAEYAITMQHLDAASDSLFRISRA
jgi:hypothetical protein